MIRSMLFGSTKLTNGVCMGLAARSATGNGDIRIVEQPEVVHRARQEMQAMQRSSV
jgi:hypothetical protein